MSTPQFKTFIPSEAPTWYTSKSWDKQFEDDIKKPNFKDLKQWKKYLKHVSKAVLKASLRREELPEWFRHQIDTELGRREGGNPFMKYLSQFSSSILSEIHEKIGVFTLAKIFLKVGRELVEFTSKFRALGKADKKKLLDYIKNPTSVKATSYPTSVKATSSTSIGFEPTEGLEHFPEWTVNGAGFLLGFMGVTQSLTLFETTVLWWLLLIMWKLDRIAS